MIQGSCYFYERDPLMESHNPAQCGGHRHYGGRDVFSLSHDLVRPGDESVEWYLQKPLKVCHQAAMFDGHRHGGSGFNLSRDLARPRD